jgi:hypothetical protein
MTKLRRFGYLYTCVLFKRLRESAQKDFTRKRVKKCHVDAVALPRWYFLTSDGAASPAWVFYAEVRQSLLLRRRCESMVNGLAAGGKHRSRARLLDQIFVE